MSHRCILLVDTDQAFHRMLSQQIGPYGVEVALLSPTDPDVLTKASHLDPVLMIIAVEEPEKIGYSLCNKAKKGVAANLPVILVTATVAPKGFENHRKLKFHADEYVDKRGLNPAEIVGKIDNLISLGEPEDELQIPVEVDDVPLDLADAEVVESLDDGADFADEEGGPTSVVSPRAVDSVLGGELDDAFAAITDFGDEPEPEPVAPPMRAKKASEPPPPPPRAARPVALPAVQELEVALPGSRHATPGGGVKPTPPPVIESNVPEDFGESEPSIGVPEPIDAHHDEMEAEEVNAEWSGEIPEPIGDLGDFDQDEATSAGGPPLADMLRASEARPVARRGAASAPTPQPAPDDRAEPVAEFELDAEPVFEAPVVASAPMPMPEPEPEPEPMPAPEPMAAPEPAPAPTPPAADSSGLDLGLEEVAARADAEQSGVHDRRTLQQIGTLQRDNARLKAELDKARAADTGAKSSTREREFLHLREMIAGKDKEILELRDELVVKDRQTLDGKEKIRQLQHTRTQLEGKNLEMEQRIIGDAERVEAFETARKELEVQAADLTARLAAVETRAKADADSAAKAIAERSAQATMLDRELTLARARAGELERGHAETVAALARNQDTREAELRAALERGRDEAVEALRNEMAQAQASQLAALEAAHAEALASKDRERGGAVVAAESAAQARIAELEQRHGAELAATVRESETTLAAERERHQDALEAQRAGAELALAAERARADQAVSEAAAHLAEVTATSKAATEKAIAEVSARAQDELVAVVAANQGELDRLAAEHQRAQDELRAELEAQVARTRAAAIADRDRLVAEHGAAIEVLTGDRDRSVGELAAARTEAETLRNDLTAFADRARHDLSAATDKARKDLEIAGRERDQIVASLTTQNDAALNAAREEQERVVSELRAEADLALTELRATTGRELDALRTSSASELAALRTSSAREISDLRAEKQQVEQGLSSARDVSKRLEDELAAARETIAARERDVEAQAAAVAERDQRLAQLRGELEALEQENAGYQEQVLKAYQKIKSDEQTVTRAKKAMAIALTLLDEEKKNAGGAG